MDVLLVLAKNNRKCNEIGHLIQTNTNKWMSLQDDGDKSLIHPLLVLAIFHAFNFASKNLARIGYNFLAFSLGFPLPEKFINHT